MRALHRIIPFLFLALAATARLCATTTPTSLYNLAGFAEAAIGGGEIAEGDSAYRRVSTPLEFVAAMRDANAGAPAVRVIEITSDLNLGWLEVGEAVRALAANPLRPAAAAPKLHPVLKATGVSVLDIKPAKPGLTIFSTNGATLRHVNFNIKGCSNIIIRNLRFDELWEWDEATKGDYDANDWDFITLGNGGPVSDVWIDHCTFTKSYDGLIDMKAGAKNVTVSWCRYTGDDGATNPDSFVRRQIAALEDACARDAHALPFYDFLRAHGFSADDIVSIIQGQKKGSLLGANEFNPENATITATFHHLLMENVWDRATPRLRGGNAHCYNLYADDTRALAAKRLRDARAAAMPAAARATLDKTYHFQPPLNGCISTEGGALLLEKSVYIDCLWPLRNNQSGPGKPRHTGKILALDTICQLRAADGSSASFRGNSTDAGSPLAPAQAPAISFSWNLPGGSLPYQYTMDDPTELPAILAAGAGAGAVVWSKDNWLKTAYTTPPADQPPTIIVQPSAQMARAGGAVTFTVAASGSPVLAYQWYKNNAPLPGATASTLTLSEIGAANAGAYHVSVSNELDTVISNSVTLTLAP